ncbi:hypothetical protein ACFRAE_00110 [Sphingobacterium sp. HJSM2_6]|uniref:hypothetical protein n=1 Tax=Sphingobacterium sp. HJSM2_6 TaxID=3366264 RepID=UPI003BDC0466
MKAVLKSTIEVAMHTATNETDIKKQLLDKGINTLVKYNDERRTYPMTFIDHENRNFWKGSALDKNFSANVFNDWRKGKAVGQGRETEKTSTQNQPPTTSNPIMKEEPYTLFNFLNREQPTDDLWIDG